jgi:hypothetical protein
LISHRCVLRDECWLRFGRCAGDSDTYRKAQLDGHQPVLPQDALEPAAAPTGPDRYRRGGSRSTLFDYLISSGKERRRVGGPRLDADPTFASDGPERRTRVPSDTTACAAFGPRAREWTRCWNSLHNKGYDALETCGMTGAATQRNKADTAGTAGCLTRTTEHMSRSVKQVDIGSGLLQ